MSGISGDVNVRRSQAIQRLPVNSVLAKLTLHDGARGDALLFIPPGEDITRIVSPGPPFVPMIRNAQFALVARDAIAALAVVVSVEPLDDDALPIIRQRARLALRSGVTLEGELRWISFDGHKRTSDHLNDPEPYIVVHTAEPRTAHYVVKAHIATVEELR
jgi:hypothetical protein